MDEAQELALIRSVLVETFPEESGLVGKTNLNDIVQRRGQVRIVPIPGARLDWTEALILLANGAMLVSHALAFTKNNFDSRRDGRTEIHFHLESHVIQNVRIEQVDRESNVTVSAPVEFTVPPEITETLGPAKLEKLIRALVSYLNAMNEQGSRSHEPE